MINELHITNFKGFEQLDIPRLGAFNLFVGRNGIGKTSVLEAISILRHGTPAILACAQARDSKDASSLAPVNAEKAVFRGNGTSQVFDVQKEKWQIETGWKRLSDCSPGALDILGSTLLANDQLAEAWDNASLAGREEEAIEAVRSVIPSLKGITFVGGERVPLAKLHGQKQPVPLRTLGEGAARIFSMALALVNASDRELLLDEIDTGIYFDKLPDILSFLLRVGQQHKVQIFATTHSSDCLRAFIKLALQNPGACVLIRLDDLKGSVRPRIFSDEELAIVLREGIEVR